MTDRRIPLDESEELTSPDAEELASAAALARALDGGRAEPELPGDALETAALLRASAGTVQLGERRRRELRDELLASLPARGRRRSLWPSWLLPLLPVAGVAVACILLLRDEPSESAPTSSVASDQAEEAPRAPMVAVPSPASSAANSPQDEASPPQDTVSRDPIERRLAAAAQGAPIAEGSAQGSSLAADAHQALTRDIARDASEHRRDLLARAGDDAMTRAYAELDAARSRPALEQSRRALTELSSTLEKRSDDDGRLLRQDLYCRLAETALRLGEPQTALEWTRRGLALDGQPTPLLAQLEALEGDAWAALGDDERAARGYMRALNVHEKLLDEDLDGD
jgi:hypothetical protein